MAAKLSLLILITALCVAADRDRLRLRLRRGRVQVGGGRRGQARSEEELRLTRRRLASRIDPRRSGESQDDTTTSSSLAFTSTTSSSVPEISFFTTPRPTVTTDKNRINKYRQELSNHIQNEKPLLSCDESACRKSRLISVRGRRRKINRNGDINKEVTTVRASVENIKTSEKPTPRPSFVTKLSEVMNLSYKDSTLFRTNPGQERNLQYSISTVLGGDDTRKSEWKQSQRQPAAAEAQRDNVGIQEIYVNNNIDRFKTSFDDFVPRLNDVMNLSYMDSHTFRGARENKNPNKNNLIVKRRRRPMQKLTPATGRTIKFVAGRRQESDRSSAQNRIVNSQNVLNRQESKSTQSDSTSNSRMKWMWPPNSMKFNTFNFNAFDAQFSRNLRSNILLPSIAPQYSNYASHAVDTQPGARYSNSPAYSLSIVL